MERAEYHRHSRACMAETAKHASRHPAPDAPERIDHRRRRTRHDHRTYCRGSRGSASLPPHVAKTRLLRRRPADTLPLPPAHFERHDVTIICETVHQGFFAEMESIRPPNGLKSRLPCPTNHYFGQSVRPCVSLGLQTGPAYQMDNASALPSPSLKCSPN